MRVTAFVCLTGISLLISVMTVAQEEKPKTKITYIENPDGSMTAISEVVTDETASPPEHKADSVKAAAQQLVEVTPGAKRALELAQEDGVPELSAEQMAQWVERSGGTLEADPEVLKQVLSAFADEGIELKLSDIRRLVRQSDDKRVTDALLRSWQDGQVAGDNIGEAVRGKESPDCPGLVYGAGKREICLPLGALSFADEVVSFTPGEKPSQRPFNNPRRALGEPNYRNTDLADFISIGCQGELVLKFVDNVLIDVEGADLYIFEVGPFVEKTELAISTDGNAWVDIGAIEGARSDVDIRGIAPPGERFSFVKLTNAGASCGGRHSGADIDAVATVGAEIRLSLDSALLFDVGKSDLKPDALSAIDQLAVQVASFGKGVRITVEGHTDSTGSDNDNLRLSDARAKSVWDYLAKQLPHAVAEVQIKGYGESRPIAPNDTEENRAQNRRVDLLIRPIQGVKNK